MMQLITCKTCGGSVVKQGNYYVCESCGNKWIGDLSNDVHAVERVNAWQALRECDFEKASELFEAIIVKDNTNHEAYWGRALALNGIIYVNDVRENKKVPTCNNITEGSFLADKDVKKAIDLAPDEIKESYRKQAEYIEKIRIEWIEKASKEPPYDVFISFKDSDRENGIDRTQDSYDAQELYTSLVDLGYKVFFSRVSLRDKVSEHYEPYIYNAIKTAKVMIVFGEKAEYFSSTWIKNEWSRFRARIEKGEKHKNSLVVVTKNMNASDLPVALKSRQALRMEDITFFETLKKHIKRVIDESKQGVRLDKIEIKGGQISKKSSTINTETIKTREIGAIASTKTGINETQKLNLVYTYLKSGLWGDAQSFLGDVLFENPSNARARLLELFVKHKVLADSKINLTPLLAKIEYFSKDDIDKLNYIISIADKDLAENLLNAIYTEVDSLEKPNFYTLLKLVLPYNFSTRSEKIEILFTNAIKCEKIDIFNLLLTTLESNEVDRYIDYNIKFLKNAKNKLGTTKIINNVLTIQEGNVTALRHKLFLEITKESSESIHTLETLLKYCSSIRKEINTVLDSLIKKEFLTNFDSDFVQKVLRYYPEELNGLEPKIEAIANKTLECGLFKEAEKLSRIILGFNEQNATAYLILCLCTLGVSNKENIESSDILIRPLPEFKKYLTLVTEIQAQNALDLSKNQELAIENRKKKAEEEKAKKLLEERELREKLRQKHLNKIKATMSMILVMVPYIILELWLVSSLSINDFRPDGVAGKEFFVFFPPIVYIPINYHLNDGPILFGFEDVYAPIIKYAWSKNGIWLWLVFLAPIFLAILGGLSYLWKLGVDILWYDDFWLLKVLVVVLAPFVFVLSICIYLPLYILFAPVITGYLVYCRKVG
ncbi:MAG: toll/interleukin-1 receptor domain-containing protein [Clostridia bacterium]|nr:toll/interleukin-1 receptor domain-containing protein [Clostridia bacterium]